MIFTSYQFLLFLPLAVAAYYLIFRKYQWQFLLAASLVFYAFSGWQNLLYIAATIITTYIATIKMSKHGGDKRKKRPWLIACLAVNLGILAVIKYAEFVVGIFAPPADAAFFRFALPLGLSFYTFQTLSYLIDAYRSKKPEFAERNPFKLALFTSFFPQVIQGPISRFGDLKKTLFASHKADYSDISAGAMRVLFGFFKKLVVADRLLPAVRTLTGSPDEFQGVYVLLAMFLYAITLYADFTGGIDVTIGAARLFGINLKENFDRPFYSKSISEYWRRWHITMGTWFRDYIFYPMSVSKPMLGLIKPARKLLGDHWGKRVPVYIATMVTWFATGLWHGASWNFIVWGLVNGAVILISQEFTPLYERFHKAVPIGKTAVYGAFQIFRTFWLMCFIRTFDIYADVPLTFKMFGSIVTDFWHGWIDFGLTLTDCGVVAVCIAVMIAAGRRKPQSPAARLAACGALALAILIFGMYGLGYDASQFIYNKF
ncbi:alginate O-acetyltransferase [Clostridia bacterium]|nr:alginate O-acetyltransferase [Clostridia bacterium]